MTFEEANREAERLLCEYDDAVRRYQADIALAGYGGGLNRRARAIVKRDWRAKLSAAWATYYAAYNRMCDATGEAAKRHKQQAATTDDQRSQM